MSEPAAIKAASQESEGATLFDHLEELRARLFKMLLAFLVGSAVAWIFYNQIIGFLIRPLREIPEAGQIISRGSLIFTAPQEAFFVRLKVTAFAAVVLASPVILWQIWRFVAPGLYSREKRYAIPFVIFSVLLFAGGVAFAFAVLPQALRVLLALSGTDVLLLPRASEYLSFVMLLIAAFGITFEMPLVLLALTLIGVLSSGTLRRGRRTAFVLILVVAAFVTPTQDPYTMLVMTLPLVVLYELTILVSRALKR